MTAATWQGSAMAGNEAPNWSARRINTLAAALGAQRYLEIGVNRGATFKEVTLPYRVGVDPSFSFDTAPYANDSTHFFPLRSDDYFAQLPEAETFDIHFIDGLHTFEQTLRDLMNAIAHSHPRTVWLIDDTIPNDVYSSLTDLHKALSYRERSGNSNKSWHGDVFKLVYFIHDFMPAYDYRTLSGMGNAQTLMWRSAAGPRQPLFGNLEQISRLSYFDMLDHRGVLRECSEEEGLRVCAHSLGTALAR
jgi:hypothetical protein